MITLPVFNTPKPLTHAMPMVNVQQMVMCMLKPIVLMPMHLPATPLPLGFMLMHLVRIGVLMAMILRNGCMRMGMHLFFGQKEKRLDNHE